MASITSKVEIELSIKFIDCDKDIKSEPEIVISVNSNECNKRVKCETCRCSEATIDDIVEHIANAISKVTKEQQTRSNFTFKQRK